MVFHFNKIQIYYALIFIICNINLYKSIPNCPAGYYSLKQDDNCHLCPPGTKIISGNSCANCSEGYYSIGLGECYKCPKGFISKKVLQNVKNVQKEHMN
jgi:hypothetical protein